MPILAFNGSADHGFQKLPAVDFALFETYKQARKDYAEFHDLDIINSYVKIDEVKKKVVILKDKRMPFQKAKEFCEYHKAELPKFYLHYKPLSPLQSDIEDEFWIE